MDSLKVDTYKVIPLNWLQKHIGKVIKKENIFFFSTTEIYKLFLYGIFSSIKKILRPETKYKF